jgi:hypothetical protein
MKGTVKPVLRGHNWDKENVPYKTIDLFKEVEFIYSMTGQETAACLIEVTAWTNLTVSVIRY